MRQYRRKAPRGKEQNDRRYDREIEQRAKRMRTEKLDEILRGATDDE